MQLSLNNLIVKTKKKYYTGNDTWNNLLSYNIILSQTLGKGEWGITAICIYHFNKYL